MVKVREDHPLLHDGSLDVSSWLESIQQQHDVKDPETLGRALALAKQLSDEAIANRTYWSIDSVQMGIEMTQILLDLRLDTASLVAAMLYRAVREGRVSLQKIEREFGAEVATLIEGVLRMAAIGTSLNPTRKAVLGQQDGQLDNVRKMLLAMVDDVRVALVKLAERTVIIRAVKESDPERQQKLAREIFDIYAPLAHRLGIGQINWELEDLSFRYLHEDEYKAIAKLLAEKRLDRDRYIHDVVETPLDLRGQFGKAIVVGRLAARVGLSRTASVDEIVAAVAALTGRSRSELGDLLVGALPNSDAELLRLSDELSRLEHDVARVADHVDGLFDARGDLVFHDFQVIGTLHVIHHPQAVRARDDKNVWSPSPSWP